MRRRRVWQAVVFILAGAAHVRAAESVESVEKRIIERLDRLKSVQAKIVMDQQMETPTFKYVSRTEGTYELLNSGAAPPFRSDVRVTRTITEAGPKPRKASFAMLSISDGRFLFVLQESSGNRAASKGLLDRKRAMFGDRGFLENLNENH